MSLLADYLTRRQLAIELDVNERTIERWERLPDGLPYTTLGVRKLYKRSDVIAWIERRERRTPPPNVHIVRKPAGGAA